jgi:hypothetical protein
VKPPAAAIVAAVLIVGYFVDKDREARNAVAQQMEQARRDDEQRVKTLHECADAAEQEYSRQSVYAVQFAECAEIDKSKCMTRAETLEWQKRVLDEALANKKMAIDVCLAAARK